MSMPNRISRERVAERIEAVRSIFDAIDPDDLIRLYYGVGDAGRNIPETPALHPELREFLGAMSGGQCGVMFVYGGGEELGPFYAGFLDGGAEKWHAIGEIDRKPVFLENATGGIWYPEGDYTDFMDEPMEQVAPDIWTFVGWYLFGPGYERSEMIDTRDDWSGLLKEHGLFEWTDYDHLELGTQFTDLTASQTRVDPGTQVVVTGRLVTGQAEPFSTPMADARVWVGFQSDGATSWGLSKTWTDAEGSFDRIVEVTGSGTCHFRYSGDYEHLSAETTFGPIATTSTTTIEETRSSANSVERGGEFTLSAVLTSANEGKTDWSAASREIILWSRVGGGAWTEVRFGHAATDGTIEFNHVATRSSGYRFSYSGDNDYLPCTGQSVTVRVT